MTLIVFLITISILVFVHELGHFIIAKRTGVLVEEFGFGLPPRIFGIKKGETLYSINWLPFGGFVKLYGEDYDKEIKKSLKKRAFSEKKTWEKSAIILAGVIGNFLLAWLIFSYLFTHGVPVPTNKVIIEKVINNSPASEVKLMPGDQIISLITPEKNKKEIQKPDQLIKLTKANAGKEIILTIKRDNKIIHKSITPRKNPPANQGPLGIVITSYEFKKYSWWQAPIYGLVDSLKITIKIFQEMTKVFVNFITFQKQSVDITGPIGIAKFSGEIIKFGKNAYLEFLALISLNLAVINILPFPALDGGRLVLVFYEGLTKRKINKHFERNLNLIGLAILIFLAIIVSVNDIINLFK